MRNIIWIYPKEITIEIVKITIDLKEIPNKLITRKFNKKVYAPNQTIYTKWKIF